MAKIMMCTGKKGKVLAAMKHWVGLERQGIVRILGRKLQTKRALIWSYDELKVLYEMVKEQQVQVPQSLTKSLDLFQIKDQALVVVRFSTKAVEDPLLKPKILSLSRGFLAKNVHVKLDEEEIRHNDYKIERRCIGQISGPVKSVMAYRDLLEKEQLCDPKTVSYIF